MRLFRSSLLLLGETAAFGWFMIRNISFLAILPLIPLGILFCRLSSLNNKKSFCLNGLSAFFSVIITGIVAAEGLFDGKGLLTLLCLSLAVGLMGFRVNPREMERVSGWWMVLFLCVFTAMTIASLFGMRSNAVQPVLGSWRDILVFYLLAFLEPLTLGRDFRSAPLALGILLLPFGVAGYFSLGSDAFTMAEFPYLSVLSGISVSSFHHIEGVILSLYYGLGALRAAHFFSCFKNRFSIQRVIF